MNTIRFESKDAFVAALESRRAFWQDVDTKAEKKHKAAEQAWLKEARRRMEKALKMDYDELREAAGGRWGHSLSLGKDAPECPVLQEARLDSVLAALTFSQGKTFTVDSQGVWSEAHVMLTHNPNARRTVC